MKFKMEKTMMMMKAIRDRGLQSLLERKKLHLLLDLDHTLLHAKSTSSLTLLDKQLVQNPNNTLHLTANAGYVVKFRPGLDVFLKEVSKMFDLSIFTMGGRHYASMIKDLLVGSVGDDEEEVRFHEVLSRGDCLIKHKKSLDIVMSHERVVVIVDDTEEVWKNHPSRNDHQNLVKIAPYVFFSDCLKGEPTVMDEELARVFKILKSVYDGFYDGFGEAGNKDGADRDVREVLKLVRGCADEEEEVIKKKMDNRKRSCEVASNDVVPTTVDSGVKAKRLKVRIRSNNNGINLLCSATCLAC